MKFIIFIFVLLNFACIDGFLSYPFFAKNLLGTFLTSIKYDENKDMKENLMKYAVHGDTCYRDCQKNDTRVCYFKFQIKYYQVLSGACDECLNGNLTMCIIKKCVTADGFQRGFLSINFQLPSPSIHVCKHDIIIVDVFNEAEGIATSIHWHGMKQMGTQFSDGVPYLTQCPIPYFSNYRYIFYADDVGTHFYHSHSGNQKADGLSGALIVREAEADNPNSKYYDYDLPQHVLFASDWMHDFSDNYLPGMAKRSALTESLLINGRGRFLNPTGNYTDSPLSIFYVQKGKKYRFRLINSATNVCPYQFQIEKHNFTIIATELSYIKPFVADTLHYLSGERYDIVVDANQSAGDYWIRIRELEPCWKNTEVFAILRYQDKEVRSSQSKIQFAPKEPPTWNETYPKITLFNSLKPKVEDVPLIELQSYETDRLLLESKPDYSYHLFVDSPAFLNSIMFRRNNLKDFTFLTSDSSSNSSFVATINNITLSYPPFPLLLEQGRLTDSMFCNGHTLQDMNCLNGDNATVCKCIHRLKVDLGSKVEFIIYNIKDKIAHPMHLHGHKFQVVDQGLFEDIYKRSEIDHDLDMRGKNPPFKDTTVLPFPGYTRLRFHANNPGFWLFHCHFDWHISIGMALVVQVGDIDQMPKPSSSLPRCHPYSPVSMK
ncbi:unnamed protein product [Chironomus riparius]|uniref:Uncharacterized protein n=1 Tax=Chironomus riparius TaxID=315576 RepID=A0A9N9WP59_9DIPT|nr:unnamed protein product [Chironomus riparius]